MPCNHISGLIQDVAMLEADAAKGYSHNQQLNKQQVALSNEVRLPQATRLLRHEPASDFGLTNGTVNTRHSHQGL